MNQGESGIFVLHTKQVVYMCVNGRGAFQNSRPLRLFAASLIERGHRQFVLDLDRCTGLDSTFLGVLTGIGLSLRQQEPPGTVYVINANAHVRELLKVLWLDRLLIVQDSAADMSKFGPPIGGELQKLPDTDLEAGASGLPREETRELIATAHDDLIRADSRNAPKFAELTRLLREDAP